MNTRILMVDDEEQVLNGYRRQFSGYFSVDTAVGAEEALIKMEKTKNPFAVVLTDLRMPGLSGIDLLRRCREMRPDTVRIMISGNADLQATIEAVNEGSVFRFLTKPCSAPELVKGLEAGIEQHRLVTAEKELLNETLNGSVQVLTDIVSMLDPDVFGRAEIRRMMVFAVAQAMKLSSTWDIEIAAMMADIGCITLPPGVIRKQMTGKDLEETEKQLIDTLPETSSKLLAKIPRLESVAQIVLYQNKNFDGTGFPSDGVSGENIPKGARIIKILNALIQAHTRGKNIEESLNELGLAPQIYDPNILKTVKKVLLSIGQFNLSVKQETQMVNLQDLRPGDLLHSDIASNQGMVILKAGQVLRPAHLERIHNFAKIEGIKEPICIEV